MVFMVILQHRQPFYLADLISFYKPSRTLRSSDSLLLTVPDIRTTVGRRSFIYALLPYGIIYHFIFDLAPPIHLFVANSRLTYFLLRYFHLCIIFGFLDKLTCAVFDLSHSACVFWLRLGGPTRVTYAV